MSTVKKLTCPDCGELPPLAASKLTVRVCSNDDERDSYVFRCPECHKAVAKDATRRGG
jgi:RNase P subunit RPR2